MRKYLKQPPPKAPRDLSRVEETARRMIADIAQNRDDAVRRYAVELDKWQGGDFRVSNDEIRTVAASLPETLKDDFAFAAAPKQFKRGSTGIEATYYVTLKADRAALDTRIVLKNPKDAAIDYEYWTCTTLAPGSDPDHPKATGGAEIIGPIAAYSTPSWSQNLAKGDESMGPGQIGRAHV